MAKLTKRAQTINEKVTPGKLYSFEEALGLLKELSTVKFTESVDVSVNLGVDPRKSDQAVRGATVLPNGTGKTVRVAVFTQGANADAAMEAKLNLSLAELKLSVRAMNCLESENINTVRDLVQRTEDQLLEVRNFGETTLVEVQEKLTELGMHLGIRIPAASSRF